MCACSLRPPVQWTRLHRGVERKGARGRKESWTPWRGGRGWRCSACSAADKKRWAAVGARRGAKTRDGPQTQASLVPTPLLRVQAAVCVSARSGCSLSNGGQRCRSHAHRDRNRFRRVSNVVDLEGEELYVVYSRFGNCNSVILVKGKFVRLERILDSIYWKLGLELILDSCYIVEIWEIILGGERDRCLILFKYAHNSLRECFRDRKYVVQILSTSREKKI